MKNKALVANGKDNVATAIKDINAFEVVDLEFQNERIEVQITQYIPFGHKFALCDISNGSDIIKYGEKIGAATNDIHAGDHVHIHNVESKRGRGDIKS